MRPSAPDPPIHWNAYPALFLAAGLGSGIAVADAVPLVLPFWLGAGTAGLLLLAATLAPGGRHPMPILRAVAVGLTSLAAGGAAFQARYGMATEHPLSVSGRGPEEAVVTGRVVQAPVERGSSVRVVLDVSELRMGGGAHATGGRLLVRLKLGGEQDHPTLDIGDVVRAAGVLRPVRARRNPADFDYRRYLHLKGIRSTLAVEHAGDLQVLGRERRWWERLVFAVRDYAAAGLERHVPHPERRRLVTALVLGDRTVLDEQTEEDFRRTGLTHLLAVSGTHMVFVGLFFYGLLGPFLTRLRFGWRAMERTRFALTTAVVVFYTVLTGGSASAVRAAVMVVLYIGGAVLQRPASPLNGLGAAATLMLAADPATLYDLGFQLSFAAVAGIVLLYPVLTGSVLERWGRLRPVRQGVSVTAMSLAATLATAPVLLFNFGTVPVSGLVLNIPAIPITAAVMSAGLATIAAAPVEAVASAFGAAAEFTAYGLLETARLGNALLGWVRVESPGASWASLAALTLGMLAVAAWSRPRLRWRLSAASLLCLNAGIWTALPSGSGEPTLEVIFFDVGQGDAALVVTPGGRTLLVDAGLRYDGYDSGAGVLLPHLRRYGIERLDAVVLTHPHADHIGGLPALLREVPIHRVVHSEDNYVSVLTAEIDSMAESRGVPSRVVHAGDTLALDPAVHTGILSPTTELVQANDVNEASVVLRIRYGTTCFLFLGDAGLEAEEAMLASAGDLMCEVVKVGHHGSRTGSGAAFLTRALPDTLAAATAVVSVGAENGYGLPDEEVLERWRRRGAQVLTTAEEGAVWFRSDGRKIERVVWR